MKHLLIVAAICLVTLQSFAQNDRISFGADLTANLQPIKLNGVWDVGDGETTTVNNSTFVAHPEYRRIDTTAFVGGVLLHFGLKIPFFQGNSWSAGCRLSAGIGSQPWRKVAMGLNSPLIFDFPAWLYFRTYGGSVPIAFMAGYKYTIATLSHGLPMLGMEFEIKENAGIRAFGSVARQKYYTYFSNGEILPAAKIPDFGIGFFMDF